jgi:endogenous inhibitor of DNA gyrase (YacG/DUF329 family)
MGLVWQFSYLCVQMSNKTAQPGFVTSVLTMKCPRCRKGRMFKDPNAFKRLKLSHIFNMYENCPECGQKFDMGEPGFWYGTGYVSYALAVAVSATTFIAWLILIGVSFRDNRIFWWLIINTFILVALQPWLMRLSRAVYLCFFVKYDSNYKIHETKKLYED